MPRTGASKFAALSIAAALATIALKTLAWWLTGSVGLLSDAIEGTINLAGATVALAMISVAARPPDEDHAYGYSKAEYFSSGLEGTLIVIAAIAIGIAAVDRLITPRPLENVGPGLVVSAAASLINYLVARRLYRAGDHYRSIALEADARHLMTDVWTSAGVIAGVAAVWVTGWLRLDPLIAILVALNIVWTGYSLIKRSVLGLMDTAVAPEIQDQAEEILKKYAAQDGITFENFRSRQSGVKKFFYVDIQFPNDWTIYKVHAIADRIEKEIGEKIPNSIVFSHLEPFEQ